MSPWHFRKNGCFAPSAAACRPLPAFAPPATPVAGIPGFALPVSATRCSRATVTGAKAAGQGISGPSTTVGRVCTKPAGSSQSAPGATPSSINSKPTGAGGLFHFWNSGGSNTPPFPSSYSFLSMKTGRAGKLQPGDRRYSRFGLGTTSLGGLTETGSRFGFLPALAPGLQFCA